jgi:membrane-bound lytic murein transglycosylase B
MGGVFAPAHAAVGWSPLIDRLVADQFDEGTVRSLFARPEVQYDPQPMVIKLRTLVRTRDQKPSGLPAPRFKKVYPGYLGPEVIGRAEAFSRVNRAVLAKVSKKYCVPESIIVSILLVETNLGQNTGTRRAFNVLSSMAASGDLRDVQDYLAMDLRTSADASYARIRCREKADWAYDELKSLLRYARSVQADPLSIPGSIYGAIGYCQFMPSNVALYGADGDADGRIDLFSPPDALYSIGRYLHARGWKCRMSKVGQHRVILTYNRSYVYANTVLAVADRLQGPPRLAKKQRQRTSPKG